MGKRAYKISSIGYNQVKINYVHPTIVHYSCSLQWQNHFFVFGGAGYLCVQNAYCGSERRNVAVLNGNRLEKKHHLNFDFGYGGCTILNQLTVVLCFDTTDLRSCRRSNNPMGTYTKLPFSHFKHRYIRLASFDGKK